VVRPLWTGPVERDVLARIRCPLELEAERIDRTHPRFAPGHNLSRSGSEPGAFISCGYFYREARRAGQGLGSGFRFANDFRSPLGVVGRDLEGDPRTLHASDCRPSANSEATKAGNPPAWPPKIRGKRFCLALVCAIVDEDAGSPFAFPAQRQTHRAAVWRNGPTLLSSPTTGSATLNMDMGCRRPTAISPRQSSLRSLARLWHRLSRLPL
jgi:hypothetical protein